MNVPGYDITAVEVADHGILRLTFADGTSGEVDVLDRMRGPVFERARTPAGFREVHIAEGTVAWPGGAAELIFQVISERNERGSLMVTTNLPFGEWARLHGDGLTAHRGTIRPTEQLA
jgi:hypothetical protein